MMSKGKLIVIEGACDGIGKSTQYNLLIKRLKEEGKEVITHHFPSYGEYQAKTTEEYLKGTYGKVEDLSPYFINSLYAGDRIITWMTKLKKEYDQGKIVILDRYTTSSLMYQSSTIEDSCEREKFIDYIYDYEYCRLGLPKPDLVIFLYAKFESVMKLKEERKDNDGISNDIHERDINFMRKVYDNATMLAKKYNWEFIDCQAGSSLKPIEEIHEDIYKRVKRLG